MVLLYVTADQVAQPNHGGGQVTYHESHALAIFGRPMSNHSYGPCEIWGRDKLECGGIEPWKYDVEAYTKARWRWGLGTELGPIYKLPQLIHCYAGTFSLLIENAKFNGVCVTYTAAAHDVAKSRKAHEEMGLEYNYPHLNDPAQWKSYLAGYKAADVLICPSKHSADVMRGFGCTNRIEIIPHGVDLPKCVGWQGHSCKNGVLFEGELTRQCPFCDGTGIAPIAPLPNHFTVGYLGSVTAPDKGVRYLLEAWNQLAYKDAVLVLAGRDSTSPFAQEMVRRFCPHGTVYLRGWVDNVSEFYNSISLYVQPSVTEGFGIEILETAAFGRPILTSDGAGGADVNMQDWTFPAANSEELAKHIDGLYKEDWCLGSMGITARRKVAVPNTWDKIETRYIQLWEELLA